MDSELLMKSLNPELYALLVRVKSIYAICGGDTGVKVDKKTMKAFDYKKTMLISRLVQLDNLAKDKKKIEGALSAEGRDMIRMRNQMRFELVSVEAELKELCKVAAKDDDSGPNGKVGVRARRRRRRRRRRCAERCAAAGASHLCPHAPASLARPAGHARGDCRAQGGARDGQGRVLQGV